MKNLILKLKNRNKILTILLGCTNMDHLDKNALDYHELNEDRVLNIKIHT